MQSVAQVPCHLNKQSTQPGFSSAGVSNSVPGGPQFRAASEN